MRSVRRGGTAQIVRPELEYVVHDRTGKEVAVETSLIAARAKLKELGGVRLRSRAKST